LLIWSFNSQPKANFAALTVRLRLTVKRNAFGKVLKQQAVTLRVEILSTGQSDLIIYVSSRGFCVDFSFLIGVSYALQEKRVYVGRIVGGHRHHRYLGWPVAAGGSSGSRGCEKNAVPKQS
jgi:hypothetical protein